MRSVAGSAQRPAGTAWRPTAALRSFAVAFATGAVALGGWIIAVATNEGVWWQGVAFVFAFFLLPAAVGLRYALRARIVLTPDALVVVSTFSEHRFPWTDIRHAEPGYGGIHIHLRDGGTFLAGAVQKGNLWTWTGRRTRADELADLIIERASAAG